MLANELTEQEFQGWQRYFSEEPFGQSHLEYSIAILTAVVANIMRGEDQDPLKPDDFIPRFRTKEYIESGESVEGDLAWVEAMVRDGLIQRAPREIQ